MFCAVGTVVSSLREKDDLVVFVAVVTKIMQHGNARGAKVVCFHNVNAQWEKWKAGKLN